MDRLHSLRVGDRDTTRLVRFDPWNRDGEHAITGLGIDAVGVDLHGNGERVIELPLSRSRRCMLTPSG